MRLYKGWEHGAERKARFKRGIIKLLRPLLNRTYAKQLVGVSFMGTHRNARKGDPYANMA